MGTMELAIVGDVVGEDTTGQHARASRAATSAAWSARSGRSASSPPSVWRAC